MKKIISLFERDYGGDRKVRDIVTPGAEWVIAGEGIATRKFDGTCCMIRSGRLFKRYQGKFGGKFPTNFEAATEADPVTNKIQGWVPVGDGPEDKWHREGFKNTLNFNLDADSLEGTHELMGPKIQGNPENLPQHFLFKHGIHVLHDVPRDFEGLRLYLATFPGEGIVWHHSDGRMVKIKKKDF